MVPLVEFVLFVEFPVLGAVVLVELLPPVVVPGAVPLVDGKRQQQKSWAFFTKREPKDWHSLPHRQLGDYSLLYSN